MVQHLQPLCLDDLGVTGANSVFGLGHTYSWWSRQGGLSPNTPLWILGLCLPLQRLREHVLLEDMYPTSSEGMVSLECLAHWLFIGVFCFVMCTPTLFSALFSLCVYISGRHCESVIDVCPRKPCQNGGTCAVASNMPDGFICQCPPVSTVSWNWIACLSCRVL